MSAVHKSLLRWRKQLQHIYVVTSEVANLSNDLNQFSKHIELLVSNGTVQASRVSNEGGRVFTTLAKELSRVPSEIKMNVTEINQSLGELTKYSTQSLNIVRRLTQYLTGLHLIYTKDNEDDNFNLNLLTKAAFFIRSAGVDKFSDMEKHNLELLIDRYATNYKSLTEVVHNSAAIIQKSILRIKALKNIGLMTQYVGLNVASEAVKFEGAEYFSVLSKDVRSLMDKFMDKVRNIDDLLEREQKQIKELLRYQSQVSA
jgi:hypothetical protein